jgi:hypothetical protein
MRFVVGSRAEHHDAVDMGSLNINCAGGATALIPHAPGFRLAMHVEMAADLCRHPVIWK